MGISISMRLTERSYSVANNSSVVRGTVTFSKSSQTYNNNKKPGTISVCGQSASFSASFPRSGGNSGTLAYRDFTVTHNADGSKTAYGSAKFISGVSSGTVYATAPNLTLHKIPRVSTLSVNKTTVVAGQSITATGIKASSSFTDTIVLKFGNHTQTLTSGTAFTIPESWCDAVPNAISGIATITLTTKSGSSTIGSTSKNITITVPDTVVPSISSIDVSEGNSVVTGAFGDNFIQNLSTLKTVINTAGIYGSTVQTYSVSYDGKTYNQNSFTTDTIISNGLTNMVVTITDSRGRTVKQTKSITVIPYQQPNIVGVSYVQCDADGTPNVNGTNLKVSVDGIISSVENQNTRQLTIGYKLSTEDNYTTIDIMPSEWDFNSETIIPNIDSIKRYNIQITLTDKVQSVIRIYITNTSQGFTVTNKEYLLVIEENKSYTLPTRKSSTSWQTIDVGASGTMKYLEYSKALNKPVGVLSNGNLAFPTKMTPQSVWDTTMLQSNNANIIPIGSTTYKNYVVIMGKDITTNQIKLYRFIETVNTPYSDDKTVTTQTVNVPDGSWNWITSNDITIYLMDVQGNIAYSTEFNIDNPTWNVVATNITKNHILDADIYVTTTSLCVLADTSEGHKLLTTPITAFR